MKSFIAITIFSVSIFLTACKKDPQKFSTITDSSNQLLLSSPTVFCTVDPVEVNSFDAINKIADAPIDPITSGSPTQNAKNNYERIQWCLKTYKKAILKSGVFEINKTLMLNDAILLSQNLDWPEIRMLIPSDTNINGVIKVYNNCRVGFLTVNGHNFSRKGHNAGVISMLGSNSQVDNNVIMGGNTPFQPTNSEDITGVYILCGENNLVLNNQIKNNHHGVVVFNSNSNVTSNTVDQNTIYNNRSDGITLMKYGRITNNKIYLNGWDCLNGIPGAGIYSENNFEGAYIKDNEIYDNNGHNIDLINIINFTILSNKVYNPGNKYFPGCGYPGGLAPDHGCAFAMSLVNIQNSTIEGNEVRNENRSYNSVDSTTWGIDPNNFYSDLNINTPKYSDLPFGGSSIIAFCFAETDQSKNPFPNHPLIQTQQNIIRNNIFIASPNGIGYFSSRNTGFDANKNWSTQTTNYFTLNNPTGSNHGSVRCGGNWYAANNVDRNTDDAQHVPPQSNWTGSDNKNFY